MSLQQQEEAQELQQEEAQQLQQEEAQELQGSSGQISVILNQQKQTLLWIRSLHTLLKKDQEQRSEQLQTEEQ